MISDSQKIQIMNGLELKPLKNQQFYKCIMTILYY